ncbi:MAG: helix-turn-helix domain-containing protein, partial [Gemmatimonadota bacterium]
YFRLNVVEIGVPPLRERRGDLPILTEHLLTKISQSLHKDVPFVSEEALASLIGYEWPGNVRELENTLTRAMVLARGPAITPQHLRLEAPVLSADTEDEPPPGETLADVERIHVQGILARTGGNKRQSARILDISRSRLDRLISRHGIVVPDRGQGGADM